MDSAIDPDGSPIGMLTYVSYVRELLMESGDALQLKRRLTLKNRIRLGGRITSCVVD